MDASIRRSAQPQALSQIPQTSARFLLILLGNIVPGRYWEVHGTPSYTRFEVLGFRGAVVGAYIVVQSLRHRDVERLPLPFS